MRRHPYLTKGIPTGNNPQAPDQNVSHREVKALRYLLLCSAALLIVGVVSPMLTLSTFIWVKNTFSVASGVIELLEQGHIFLFLLVAGFSLLLPCIKLFLLFKILTLTLKGTGAGQNSQLHQYLYLMHAYGRWAMLDVMVVAVLIMTVKLGAIASVELHAGLYIFTTAVLLIMFITHRVVRLNKVY